MPDLPARPDLGQLRRQAKDLLRAAASGDAEALARMHAVSGRLVLASAQLAIAREHGFGSWPKLRVEVLRRATFDTVDVAGLRALLRDHPELATQRMEHWSDHGRGISPIGYVAAQRYDTARRIWRDVPEAHEMARALIDAGAPVEGEPGERETPLITAASYGDAAVARVLIEAGADVTAHAAPDAGGVPGGSALLHAAVFGMTEVVDVLVEAGARPEDIAEAAAAGDVRGFLTPETPLQDRVRALIMAADHERLGVIDELLDAGTPIDAADERWGRQALRVAAGSGRAASVGHLLARGADPNVRDMRHGRTALEWCRVARSGVADQRGHDRVEALLAPVTGARPADSGRG
jgi:ankyrin repeat protein